MPNAAKFGSKIRMLRRRHGLRQVDLAEKLGISPSYLNLIEHDQRSLTAPLLLKVAELFPGDLKSFGNEEHGRLVSDLHEVFGDTLFEAEDVTTTDLRETAANEPVSRAVVKLYRAYRNAVETLQRRRLAGHRRRRADAGNRSRAPAVRGGLGRPAGEPELLPRARGGRRAAGRRGGARARRSLSGARPLPREIRHRGRRRHAPEGEGLDPPLRPGGEAPVPLRDPVALRPELPDRAPDRAALALARSSSRS